MDPQDIDDSVAQLGNAISMASIQDVSEIFEPQYTMLLSSSREPSLPGASTASLMGSMASIEEGTEPVSSFLYSSHLGPDFSSVSLKPIDPMWVNNSCPSPEPAAENFSSTHPQAGENNGQHHFVDEVMTVLEDCCPPVLPCQHDQSPEAAKHGKEKRNRGSEHLHNLFRGRSHSPDDHADGQKMSTSASSHSSHSDKTHQRQSSKRSSARSKHRSNEETGKHSESPTGSHHFHDIMHSVFKRFSHTSHKEVRDAHAAEPPRKHRIYRHSVSDPYEPHELRDRANSMESRSSRPEESCQKVYSIYDSIVKEGETLVRNSLFRLLRFANIAACVSYRQRTDGASGFTH